MKKQHNSQPRLQITDLHVKRSATFTLEVPTLSIMPGRVTCIVGANGSGKTTLLETIIGLLRPQNGTIKIEGQRAVADAPLAKKQLGFIPDDDGWIIPELNAREYFALLQSIYQKSGSSVNHKRVDELAAHLMFTNQQEQLGALSHGNKKKVQIIAGLLHEPQLIIVDELRNGLDPIAIKQAETLLHDCKKQNAAILAATHDLWWAERFADDVVMIQNGRVVLQDTIRNIIKKSGSLEAAFMALYGENKGART